MSSSNTNNKKNPFVGDNDYYPKTSFNLGYNDNTDEEWENFRKQLLDLINKSQDDFENRLTLLSSGGLIISLTLLDKIFEYNISITLKIFIVAAIILFVASLIANFYSHNLAIKNNERNIADVDNRNHNITKNIIRRNRPIRKLNNTSSTTIILGALCLFTFFIFNFINMSNKEQKPTQKPQTERPNPKPLNEEKGRTTQVPSFSVQPKKK